MLQPCDEFARSAVVARKGRFGDSPIWLAPIPAIEYLKAARPFAGNHDLSMAFAQLDLTNRPTCRIDLTKKLSSL
jgi:hypothetical protein